MSEFRQLKIPPIPLKSSPFGQNPGVFSPVPKISQVCGHWGDFLRLNPQIPRIFWIFIQKTPDFWAWEKKREGYAQSANIRERIYIFIKTLPCYISFFNLYLTFIDIFRH